MIPSLKKRFWSEVTVAEVGLDFEITLDGHKVRTPARSPLLVPTRNLAAAIAAEWQVVVDAVDPARMPMTRRANAAIDKVTAQQAEVAAMLAEYGGSDLICYRATHPPELIMRQAAAWDPLVDWVRATFGTRLNVTAGVIHIAQDRRGLTRFSQPVFQLDSFALTGLHDLVTLSGSLTIGLAATHGFASIDDLWIASQVDEIWQAQLWGDDDEALRNTELKRLDFIDAFRFFQLVG